MNQHGGIARQGRRIAGDIDDAPRRIGSQGLGYRNGAFPWRVNEQLVQATQFSHALGGRLK